jgi:hypothetical protein
MLAPYGSATMTEIDDDLRRMAVRRAEAKLGFRSHVIAYAVVNAGLLAINLMTSPGYIWALWPMFGWGIGLVAHWASVYIDGDNVRDRMIEAEYEKLLRGKR